MSDWKPMDSAPKDGQFIRVRSETTARWRAYKPDGQRQGYPKGRWQVPNGYGGWENMHEQMAPQEWKEEGVISE